MEGIIDEEPERGYDIDFSNNEWSYAKSLAEPGAENNPLVVVATEHSEINLGRRSAT